MNQDFRFILFTRKRLNRVFEETAGKSQVGYAMKKLFTEIQNYTPVQRQRINENIRAVSVSFAHVKTIRDQVLQEHEQKMKQMDKEDLQRTQQLNQLFDQCEKLLSNYTAPKLTVHKQQTTFKRIIPLEMEQLNEANFQDILTKENEAVVKAGKEFDKLDATLCANFQKCLDDKIVRFPQVTLYGAHNKYNTLKASRETFQQKMLQMLQKLCDKYELAFNQMLSQLREPKREFRKFVSKAAENPQRIVLVQEAQRSKSVQKEKFQTQIIQRRNERELQKQKINEQKIQNELKRKEKEEVERECKLRRFKIEDKGKERCQNAAVRQCAYQIVQYNDEMGSLLKAIKQFNYEQPIIKGDRAKSATGRYQIKK
ncbi:Hypothetical_protein [Hexamita inflata]|uniref:Hypothetical_protein n=1 Tax=Hexamita inflata TaxID=28002 RepID=A0AA86R043_9EUKA|nr:Hypothetical protein HINF_LOCUS56886 [Hexamita inflata]